jgi:hypothetical protein
MTASLCAMLPLSPSPQSPGRCVTQFKSIFFTQLSVSHSVEFILDLLFFIIILFALQIVGLSWRGTWQTSIRSPVSETLRLEFQTKLAKLGSKIHGVSTARKIKRKSRHHIQADDKLMAYIAIETRRAKQTCGAAGAHSRPGHRELRPLTSERVPASHFGHVT